MPKEIKKLIFNCFDDKTKRTVRLTCTEWFNIIDYSNFAIYLTKKSEWCQIVGRLSRYNRPITLKLCKNIIKNLTDINEHLTRLTNISALSFDTLEDPDSEELTLKSWYELTSALSRLQHIEVKDYEYHIPVEALLRLNHLTSFSQPYSRDNDDTAKLLVQQIRTLTNLESCSIHETMNTSKLFDTCRSRLTNLSVYTTDVPEPVLQKWFGFLPNLKELSLSLGDPKDHTVVSLKQLTAIDTLTLSGLQLQDINSSNLTNLELYSLEEKCIEQEAHKLTNLRWLVFDFKARDGDNSDSDDDSDDDCDSSAEEPEPYSYQWLTALTSLQFLNIDPMQHNGLAFVPTQLPALQFWVRDGDDSVDLTHLSRFEQLQELYMDVKGADDVSHVSKLTRLERLSINLKSGETTDLPFSLSMLSNLTWLYLGGYRAEIAHLPNLEELKLKFASACKYSSFDDLPKLKKFSIAYNFDDHEDFEIDYAFLPKMATLTSLVINHMRTQPISLKYLSVLTDLQVLDCGTVDDEGAYDVISSFTKLTELQIWHGILSPKVLNLPTSLQKLSLSTMKPKLETNIGEDNEALIAQMLERLPNLVKSSVSLINLKPNAKNVEY